MMTTTTTQSTAPIAVICKIEYTDTNVTIHGRKGAVCLSNEQLAKLPRALAVKISETTLDCQAREVALTIDEMKTLLDTSRHTQANHDTRMAMVAGATRMARGSGDTIEERNITRAHAKVQLLKEDLHILVYDIPEEVKKECPNPSPWMWWYGFRLNDSVWVLPESKLNCEHIQQTIAHWKKHGVIVHTIYQAPREMEKIRGIGVLELDKEIRKAHESFIRKLVKADNELIEASKKALQEAEQLQSARGAEEAVKEHIAKVRTAIIEAGKRLASFSACAENFEMTDLTPETEDKSSITDLLEGLRQCIIAHANTFNATAKIKGIKFAPVPN